MTDSYPSTTPDDIITEGDDMSRRLERDADALLAGSSTGTLAGDHENGAMAALMRPE